MAPRSNAPRPLPGNAAESPEGGATIPDPLNAMGAAPIPLVDVDDDGPAGAEPGGPENPMGDFQPRRVAEPPAPPRMPMPRISDEITEDPHLVAMTDAEIEKEIRERWGEGAENKRIAFGSSTRRLPYKPRRGFHRHVFNDFPGRIEQATRAGYKHVEDEQRRPIATVVGTDQYGGPLRGYLMEIPEEWYRKDMAAAQADLDELDREIRGGVIGAKEGDGRYGAGIRIERQD